MPFFLYKDAIAGKGVLLKFCVRNFDRYLLLIYFIIVNLVTRNKGDTVCTNIEPTHCLEVTLSSHYCAIFGCCNTTEYYKSC